MKPKVVYEYTVDGMRYTSARLALVEEESTIRDLAKEKVSRYAAGQQVTVYYDPKKPENATLEIGDPTGGTFTYLPLIIGLILTVIGVIWLLSRFH
jgi:hypothetical protein